MLLSEIQPGRRLIDSTIYSSAAKTLLFGRSDDAAGRKGIPGRRLKAVTSAKKRSELYPLLLLYTVALRGHVGPGREERIARAGARMDGIGRRRMALALDKEERLSRTDLRL